MDAGDGEALSAESVITHYDTFSLRAAKCRGLSEDSRRHKLHISRPAASGRTQSFRCASSPKKSTDFLGARVHRGVRADSVQKATHLPAVSPCIWGFPALHIHAYAAASIAAAYMSFALKRCVRTYRESASRYVRTLRIAAKLIYVRSHYGFNPHEAPHAPPRRVRNRVAVLEVVFARRRHQRVAETARLEGGQVVFLAPHPVNLVAVL